MIGLMSMVAGAMDHNGCAGNDGLEVGRQNLKMLTLGHHILIG